MLIKKSNTIMFRIGIMYLYRVRETSKVLYLHTRTWLLVFILYTCEKSRISVRVKV